MGKSKKRKGAKKYRPLGEDSPNPADWRAASRISRARMSQNFGRHYGTGLPGKGPGDALGPNESGGAP